MNSVFSIRMGQLMLSLMLLTASFGHADMQISGEPSTTRWLFVQTASSGSLEPIKGEKDAYQLTLKGVSEQVIAFTDRPARDARTVSINDYVKNWSTGPNSFQKSPPNAALEIETQKGLVTIFTIDNPKYDMAANTLTYKAKRIESNPTLPSQTAGQELPKTFLKPVLFIDDSISWLGG